MDFLTVIGIIVWIFGAYKGWNIVSGWKWQWINQKESLNYFVKGSFCVLLGFGFLVIALWKFAWNLAISSMRT